VQIPQPLVGDHRVAQQQLLQPFHTCHGFHSLIVDTCVVEVQETQACKLCQRPPLHLQPVDAQLSQVRQFRQMGNPFVVDRNVRLHRLADGELLKADKRC